MSALSPAPAPTSGVRWTDLPTPLDSALPSCCLSYKQSAFCSPLCFHSVANCFFGNSFVFKIICVAPWCFPLLCDLCAPNSVPSVLRFFLQLLSFCVFSNLRTLSRSLSSFSSACRLFSEACSLFLQNTGGGGYGVAHYSFTPSRAEGPFHSYWDSIQCLT
jgi:hypothetical protein